MDFAPFGESTFSLRDSLHARHPERRRGEVLSVALRTRSAEQGRRHVGLFCKDAGWHNRHPDAWKDEAVARNATMKALAKEDCFTSTSGLPWLAANDMMSARTNHEAAHRGRVHEAVRPLQGV